MVGIKEVIVFMLAVCLASNGLTMSLAAKDSTENDKGARLYCSKLLVCQYTHHLS